MNAVVDTHNLSWPARRPESWKYTDLKRLGAQMADQLDSQPPASSETVESPVPLQAITASWLDARLQSQASELPLQQQDVAQTPDFGLLPAQLCEAAPQQVYRLDLGREHHGKTIHLQFAHSLTRDALSSLQLDIQVAEGVQLTLVEEHLGGRQGLALVDLNWQLAADSDVQHIRLQHNTDSHLLVARQKAEIAAAARLKQMHVDWGGRLSRLDSQFNLNAPDAQLEYYALSGLKGRQHCDHQVDVRHMSAQCKSVLRARGILDEAGRQVFNGKIYVARDAQQTDSDQLLRNLLLSDKAEVDVKPELEIYADDVRCAHGSTVGRLDDEALFYLRSRGLDETTARRLLLLSFAQRILGEIDGLDELAEHTRQAFADHLSLQAVA